MNITYAKIKKITQPFFQTATSRGLLKYIAIMPTKSLLIECNQYTRYSFTINVKLFARKQNNRIKKNLISLSESKKNVEQCLTFCFKLTRAQRGGGGFIDPDLILFNGN